MFVIEGGKFIIFAEGEQRLPRVVHDELDIALLGIDVVQVDDVRMRES